MDVRVRITWADGSSSEHDLAGLPYDDAEAAQEALEHKLADYLPDVGPTDADGLPLGWIAVEIID